MTSTKNINTREFPVGTEVILINLIHGSRYNNQVGIVESTLLKSGRQNVRLKRQNAGTVLALQPKNLKLKMSSIDSLSIKEMKQILSYRSKQDSRLNFETRGIEKADLLALVHQSVNSDEEMAAILSSIHANDDGGAKTAIYGNNSQYNFKNDGELYEVAWKFLEDGNREFEKGNVRDSKCKYSEMLHILESSIHKNQIKYKVMKSAALDSIGKTCHALGEYKNAVEHLNMALDISKGLKDPEGMSGTLNHLGITYLSKGEFETSIKYLKLGLELGRNRGDQRAEEFCLGHLGCAYDSLGKYKEAINYHKLALNVCKLRGRNAGDRRSDGTHIGNIGNSYLSLGEYKNALEHFNSALNISKIEKDKRGEAADLINLGRAFQSLSRYENALKHFQMSLKIQKDTKDLKGEASCLGNIGNTYHALGEYDDAMKHFKLALDISIDIGDLEKKGTSLANIGNSYHALGDYDKAIVYQTQALQLREEIGDRKGEGLSLGDVGTTYLFLNKIDEAIEKYRLGAEVSGKIGDKKGEGAHLGNIGIAFGCLGEYKISIEYHKKALEINKRIGNRQGQRSNLGNLGLAYESNGDIPRAIESYKLSIGIHDDIWGEMNTDPHRISFDDIASHYATKFLQLLLSKKGEVENALLYCEYSHARSLELLLAEQQLPSNEMTSDSLPTVGASDLDCMHELARKQQSAIVIYSQVSSTEILVWVIRSDEKRSIFHKCITIPTNLKCLSVIVELVRRSFGARARINERDNNPSLNRNVGHRNSQGFLYFDEEDVMSADNEIHATIQSSHRLTETQKRSSCDFSERKKKLKSTKNHNRSHEPFNFLLKIIYKILAMPLYFFIEILFRSIRSLTGKIKKGNSPPSDHYVSKTDGNDLSYKDEDDTFIVEDDHVSKTHLSHGIAGSGEGSFCTLIQRPAEFKSKFIQHSPQETSHFLLNLLYEILLEPLEPALKEEKRLIIIPDSDLYQVPFAALCDKNNKALIEKFTLSFAPSIGTLVQLDKRFSHRTSRGVNGLSSTLSALIVGDPYYHGWMSQLPGARDEARKIKTILGSKGNDHKTKILIDQHATKDQVVDAMKDAQIIHFASHGAPDGIFLSGKTREEGKLTMAEVQNLDLKTAKMVILSACDTFKGRVRSDGVVGITRAFIAAGAPSLIASLWPVGDRSAKKMMNLFYDNLFPKKLNQGTDVKDVGDALRRAMIKMKNDGDSVLEWAPFIFYGVRTEF